MFGRGSDAMYRNDIRSADLVCLEGVPIRRPILISRALSGPGSFGGKAAKRSMGRMHVPYHAPVTCVLGGEASGAFNAPARVRASGGGQCVCARRRPTRSSPLPYSMVVGARPPIDSLDALSVFEAKAVDCCAYARPGRRVEGFDVRIILLGVSVRVPLTDTLDKQ